MPITLQDYEPTLPLQPIPETADPADNEVCESGSKSPADLEPNDPSFLLEVRMSLAENMLSRSIQLHAGSFLQF